MLNKANARKTVDQIDPFERNEFDDECYVVVRGKETKRSRLVVHFSYLAEQFF